MSHQAPHVGLVVNGTPLPQSTMGWISDIDLLQTCDGADILTINANAWDEIQGTFRLLDERGLFPGNKIEVWADYGNVNAICKGKFTINTRKPHYGPDGVTISLIGFDGLRSMMDNTQARCFEKVNRDSEVITKVAEIYGFAGDVLPTPVGIPENAPVYAPKRTKKKAVEPTPILKGDRVKPVGMTDLAWLKGIAETWGYAYPKIRYDAKKKNEILVFRPPADGVDEWSQTFWYVKPGAGKSDIITFDPEFSVADAPTGAELLGWDPVNKRPFRVVATMSATGPLVTWDYDVRLDEKIEKEIKSGASLRLSILGSSVEKIKTQKVTISNKTWNPEKEVRTPVWMGLVRAPEVVSEPILTAMVERWLIDRQAAWWTCTFTLENQPGIHLLDSDQVHEIRGVCPMDEGLYIILEAHHRWSAEGGHTVACKAQKLIVISDMNVKSMTEVLA